MGLTKIWSLPMENEPKKTRPNKPVSVPGRVMFVLCFASFLGGCLFTSHTWLHHPRTKEPVEVPKIVSHLAVASGKDCDPKHTRAKERHDDGTIMEQVGKTHQAIRSLDRTISKLEMELAVARTARSNGNGKETATNQTTLQRAFVVVGINTAFSSKKRRDSLRQTWMPRGEKLKEVEKEKGIVVRFVIGHSATKGGILDRAIDEEDAEHADFLRLNHVEGYHQLSTKTRLYFSTAISLWDADFYVKVDDDVHLNLGMLASALARHRAKQRIYIGCMKSGPVLYQKGVKYHEPEHWKFGEEGNRYFRHATGQIYAISKDLATYIAINSPILHRYANEDVSLGAWFIGLEVEHIDEHAMCCGTPPDCTLKAQAGNICVASFDWGCSGICNSVERMKEIHSSCGEGDAAVLNVDI